MAENQWEQTGPGVGDGVDEILQRYAQDGDMPANGSGPGPSAASDGVGASGESSDDVSQVVERVLERLGSQLDQKLTSMRQDLQTYAERTAQSFSDKAASRLTQRQREQMEMVERTLAPLREQLGPDYDDALRQAKLNVMFSGGAPGEGQAEPVQPAQAASRPAGGESADQFAGVYLSQRLGDPRDWNEEDTAAIQADLSQARDWAEWMAVVDRYAQRRPSSPWQGQGPQERGATGNIARAQPVGAASGRRPTPSLDQLNAAYNRAVADGDIDAVNKLGAQIDVLLKQG